MESVQNHKDEVGGKGYLLKRKDFVETDKEARSHPNRTYYFKSHDLDTIIETCSKKLKVSLQSILLLLLHWL